MTNKYWVGYEMIAAIRQNHKKHVLMSTETTVHLLHAIQRKQLPLVHLVEHTCEICCSY